MLNHPAFTKIKYLFAAIFLILFVVFAIPANAKTAAELQDEINALQQKISDLQSQSRTLSSQIAVMDSQIRLTTLRIESTKAQINELTLDIDTTDKKINKLEHSLDALSKALVNRIVGTYIVGSANSFQTLLSSSDISDFVKRANYLRIAQAHDRRLIYDTVQAKNDYSVQKEIFVDKKDQVESLKAELEGYTNQLAREKTEKDSLLRITQSDERKYQQLLAQAQAEYQAIVGIIAGKGTETQVRNVSQGEVIATVIQGASCNSSGTHLHFTVSQNGSALNPFGFLKSVDHVNYSNGDPFNPSGSWDWPLNPTIQFNQGFGDTWYVRTYHFYPSHNGIDIYGSSASVKAVKSGVLFRGSYGGYNGCTLPYMRVHHNDDGLDTFYLHTVSS